MKKRSCDIEEKKSIINSVFRKTIFEKITGRLSVNGKPRDEEVLLNIRTKIIWRKFFISAHSVFVS